MANVKFHGHMVDISKFPKGVNEQLLKVSAGYNKSSWKQRVHMNSLDFRIIYSLII